ncbi:hypothetical protein U1Q18_014650 [Sarracenia purpurea var. burkii]
MKRRLRRLWLAVPTKEDDDGDWSQWWRLKLIQMVAIGVGVDVGEKVDGGDGIGSERRRWTSMNSQWGEWWWQCLVVAQGGSGNVKGSR